MAGNLAGKSGILLLAFAAMIAAGTAWAQSTSDADKQFVRSAI